MIDEKKLNKLREEYNKNDRNIIKHRIFNKVSLIDLVTDKDTIINMNFSLELKTHNIINQNNSGRCWSFAGLNILREKIIDKCNLDDFILSGSYIAFYDKLERFNSLMERLINYKKDGKDLYDRYVSYTLENGITDGGYYTQFANLVNKYGIVPNDIYPESFQSSNTYEINLILSRLLRKFYLDLESCNHVDKLKNDYLEKVYNLLSDIYGDVPTKFDFEYTDKDSMYHIDKDLTPIDFYNKYVGIDLFNDFVCLSSYEDNKYKLNNMYKFEQSNRISGTDDNVVLNIGMDRIKELILKQLENKEYVYIYSCTTSKRTDGVWNDILEKYSELFDIDLVLDHNDIIKTNALTGMHAMIITGVNLVDGKPNRWKLENSWGEKYGKNGYYIATNSYIDKYLYGAVINKKYLNKEELMLLEKQPIMISKWDMKF